MKVRESLRIICEASGDRAIPESALDEQGELDEADVSPAPTPRLVKAWPLFQRN